jgi:hypothetical protein
MDIDKVLALRRKRSRQNERCPDGAAKVRSNPVQQKILRKS